MSDIKKIINKLVEFRNERDWKQFHNPKDLSIALSIESSELMELFLWKKDVEIDQVDEKKVKEELADIFSYAFLLVQHYGFDLEEIINEKIQINSNKYPIEKSKGKATKYKDL